MTSTRGRAVVGALAVVGAVIAWPHAAAAYVCGFAVENPTPGSISSSSTVRLRGSFEVAEGVPAESRVLEITFVEAPGPPPPPLTRSGDIGPAGRFDIAVGPLARNGRYTARVKAIHAGAAVVNCSNELGSEGRDTERTADVPFSVSVRAGPPSNVKASFNSAARNAAVTWDKSGDPDIAGYTVVKKVGTAAATEVDVPADPLSWTDTKLPATEATITYSVRAMRNGASPGARSEPSDAVAAPPVKIPAAPSRATTTTTPAGAPTTLGTATTVPFVLNPPVGALPADPSATALPNDGSYLPPSLSLPDDQSGPLDGGDQAVVGDADAGGDEQIPQLAYVASALLSTVVAAHVLWLRRQVARPEPEAATRATPLEPLEPEPSPRPPLPESPPDADELSAFAPVAAAAAAATPMRPAGGPVRGLRPEAVGPPVILVPPRERNPVGADRRQPAPGEAAADGASKPGGKPVLVLRPRRPEPP